MVAAPLLLSRKGPKWLRQVLLYTNLGLFTLVCVTVIAGCCTGYLYAAEATEATSGSSDANGWAFIAAALATGMGSIGAGIAVAAAAPAAIGALAENENNFGKAMIFVGLGEGLAIFGLLVSILVLQKVP